MPETKPSAATPLHHRRAAIVVGASSGIGAALTRKLAAEGYIVAAVARRADLLEALCAEINAAHGETRALPYPHDVTRYDSVPAALQKILQELGGLDLFIYNTGIQQHVKADALQVDSLQQCVHALIARQIAGRRCNGHAKLPLQPALDRLEPLRVDIGQKQIISALAACIGQRAPKTAACARDEHIHITSSFPFPV